MSAIVSDVSGVADKIAGAERVIDIFGQWPSFHDAEILWLRLDRSGLSVAPELEAAIHVFEMSSDVTPDGCYVLRNHTLATLRFEGVRELQLEGFNEQNALMGVTIGEISDRQLERLNWEVCFDAAHGLDATFLCERIAVVSVEPYGSNEDESREPDQSAPRPGEYSG